jgi:hypothetical protein
MAQRLWRISYFGKSFAIVAFRAAIWPILEALDSNVIFSGSPPDGSRLWKKLAP